MKRVRDALHLCLLAICCAIGVAVFFLVVHADQAQGCLEQRLDGFVCEGQRRMVFTFQNANAALIQLGLATDEWRRASQHSSVISENVERLTDQENARLAATHQRMDELLVELRGSASAGTVAIGRFGDAAGELGRQTAQVGNAANGLLADSGAVMKRFDGIVADPSIGATVGSLAAGTAHLEHSLAEWDELVGYWRDLFSPKKRSFWLRLLEFLLPRPTVKVGR